MNSYRYYGGDSLYDFFNDPALVAGLGMFLTAILIFALLGVVINLVLYILRSIGLYKIAVNRGMSGAGLAWIPFVGYYRIGSIADDIAAREGTQSYFRYFLLAGSIVSFLFSSASSGAIISSIVDSINSRGLYGRAFPRTFMAAGLANSVISLISLTVFVLTIVALNKIYKNYRPASSTAWTVLSILPFMQSIFLFVIRKDAPVPPEFTAPWNGSHPHGGYYPTQGGQWQPAPPPPPTYHAQQPPVNPNGYYPPRAPEPPQYQPPHDPSGFVQPPPVPPWESGNPPMGNPPGGNPPSDG